jgi:hypothetical protein
VIHKSDLPDGESEILPVGLICRRHGGYNLSTSLRANGSRECAPDDRLREAIHFDKAKKEWIASSQGLLAMTLTELRSQ